MKREDAIAYLRDDAVDDAQAIRKASERPDNARLIGWQCGAEPMFIAVWSYLGARLDDDEAVELAQDYLAETKWFSGAPTPPDFIL
jgi:hypothetical protein